MRALRALAQTLLSWVTRGNALRALALFIAVWLVGFVAVDQICRNPEARTTLVNEALGAISDGMRGEMEVGEVEHLSLRTWTVAARDFRVRDEHGVQVLHVEHAAIVMDPWALLDGEVRVTRARGVRGQLDLSQRPDGEIGLDRAFQGTGEPGSFSLSPVVRFDAIDAVNVRVHIAARGADIVGHRVYGEVRLTAGSDVPTRVRLRRVRGQVEIVAPVRAQLRVVWLRGRLDSDAVRRFDARASTRFLGDPLEGRVGIVRGVDGQSRFVAEADGEGLFGDLGDALVSVLTGL